MLDIDRAALSIPGQVIPRLVVIALLVIEKPFHHNSHLASCFAPSISQKPDHSAQVGVQKCRRNDREKSRLIIRVVGLQLEAACTALAVPRLRTRRGSCSFTGLTLPPRRQ